MWLISGEIKLQNMCPVKETGDDYPGYMTGQDRGRRYRSKLIQVKKDGRTQVSSDGDRNESGQEQDLTKWFDKVKKQDQK